MRFAEIHDLATNIKRINIDSIAENALQDHQYEISELNRDQLREGVKSTGAFMPNYSKASVYVYGKPDGPIQLFETGDFYDGLKPKFAEHDFTIEGLDEKTDMLTKRYGPVIGLTEESQGELAQIILSDVQSELRQRL